MESDKIKRHRSEDTVPSGNTRHRRYQLTLNEPERWDALRDYITELKSFRYGIAGLEKAPTTGHEHIHFYVCFNNPIKLNFKKTQGAHVEICRGGHRQNVDYIKKEDTKIIFEEGDEPHQGTISASELKNMTQQEIVELNPEKARAYIYAKNILDNSVKISEWNKDVKVFYVHGPSGCGKSTWAQNYCIEHGIDSVNLVSFKDEFWSGIGDEKVAIFEEFRDSIMKPDEFIKFIDYRKQRLNIKGSSCLNNYTTIIITSVQDPEHIYPSVAGEPRIQWLRRMQVIDLTPYDETL